MVEKRNVVFITSEIKRVDFIKSLSFIDEIHQFIIIDLKKEMQNKLLDQKIKYGTYQDCNNADIVIIAIDNKQKYYQTRLQWIEENTVIIKDITNHIMESGFKGIIIVDSQPIDFMTYVVSKTSHLPLYQVLGTGTMLDTKVLQNKLSKLFNISSKNIYADVIGEHGNYTLISWNHCYIGNIVLKDYMEEHCLSDCQLEKIYLEMKDIDKNNINEISWLYLLMVILKDKNEILNISCLKDEEYFDMVYTGRPAIVSRNGIKEILKLELENKEKNMLEKNCNCLFQIIETRINPLL